ncbi:PREDICTED: protein tiptop [Bactrocera latifrons]|uniref:protein tiptop n=1 Tax=Bactrocera latifrons TaxID=174628 RepID=UPI0008DD1103|nr:PREDICTED: protein tiptop [Bactrocera latifrons]
MMLHEAVMLEIYRQALTASELTSPRCQSRESNVSAAAMEGRCPSNGSHCSGNERSTTPATSSLPSTPPAGLPLQATLAPAAAAALLPPQSAAMAAYFNAAAAAAAQQNHLLLTNPLAAAATLVQQATQAHSPAAGRQPTTPTSPQMDATNDEPVLDFSTKRRRMSERESDSEDDNHERNADDGGIQNAEAAMDVNSPLDLTVGGRKRAATIDEPPPHIAMHKSLRTALPTAAASNWVPTINPYLAAVAAASLSPPKSPLSPLEWSGKHKLLPNEATKALEKMTEMTRLGSATDSAELPPHRQLSANGNNSSAASNVGNGGRHSAWQSHWLNKGADAVRDVFKCVWCKQSFPTLATLTVHMKETQHCGVNMPATASAPATGIPTNGNQSAQSTHHLRHTTNTGTTSAGTTTAATGGNTTTAANKSDLNLLIKETMPLPRKLVRGQDVWLGKGAEQTREILKCMWCGQSFRSLAEMTSHMQETQHYTNIISQEQIISWKSTDDKSSNSSSAASIGGSGGGTTTTSTSPVVTTPPATASGLNTTVTMRQSSPSHNNNSASATVSAVLTCKVCDQAFATLKELSNHMMKNSHYKEHMMRAMGGVEQAAMTPTTTAGPTNVGRRGGRQLREKRKKSLPVRKLLELERAQQDYKLNSLDPALKPLRDFAAITKITCEKCGEKIETALFVDHIRQCLGGMLLVPARNHNNVSDSLKSTFNAMEQLASPQTPTSRSDGRKTADSNMSHASATRPDILCPLTKEGEKASTSSTPSVLNAIEQLIEKSFDTRPRNSSNYAGSGNGSQRSTPLGSSILKRLGIDDSVDYTKPLLDPQTMHFMRSYSNYSARDRSASESSSISERCSSRIESFTPERNTTQVPPRQTPDKLEATVEPKPVSASEDAAMHTELLNIKSEPTEIAETTNESQELPAGEQKDAMNLSATSPQKISVKKEFNMIDNHEDERQSGDARHYKPQPRTPCSRATSPSASERSITPKSTTSSADKRFAAAGSSLTALSSMFDSLNNMSSNVTSAQSHNNVDSIASAETNNNNNNNNTNKKSSANPLAALQKLCETTEKPSMKTRSATTNGIGHHQSQLTGNMMAFSWACNDAVQNTTAESMIKCTQCDAVFSTKGAYRHHFSKVHYSKEDNELNALVSASKSPSSLACSPKSAGASPKSSSKSPVGAGSMSAPIINPFSDSSQSKFLKYTELAKQLSSKNA